MKKTKMKCFLIILTLLLLLFSCTQVSADVLDNPDTYKPDTSGQNNDQLINIGSTILSNINTIGTFVSVAVLIGLGIKYLIRKRRRKSSIQEDNVAIFYWCNSSICRK